MVNTYKITLGPCASFLLTVVIVAANAVWDVAADCTSRRGVVNPPDDMSVAPSEASSCTPQGRGINTPSDEAYQSLPRQQSVAEPGVWSGQHIRNPLARAVYFKMKEDEQNKDNRHVYWYRVIVSRFPEDLQAKFVQFEQDEGTSEFLDNCQEKSNQIFTQLFYSLARPLLNIFMTQTSINGFLNRGSMFIFSKNQIEHLLGFTPYHKEDTLLDLGAGDGLVTKQMAGYFHKTYTTEMSGVMVRRLTGLGFNVLGVNDWQSTGVKYDLVSCLNLLDRCDKPLSLLADIKSSMKPVTGRLLVAVVIPFKPYVEFDSHTHEPSEFIHIKGSNFEEQVEQFVSIFHRSGFQVEKFSRLPYLCEGDLRHSYYVLTDAIFVLKVIP
uniref:Methyltransferase-like protein 9 n=1 Tax=Arion vulgaris TaxID=1028688 RepID=A0A0B6ZGU8_9EUPU